MVDSEDVEKKPDEYFTSFSVICASCASTNTMVSFVWRRRGWDFQIINYKSGRFLYMWDKFCGFQTPRFLLCFVRNKCIGDWISVYLYFISATLTTNTVLCSDQIKWFMSSSWYQVLLWRCLGLLWILLCWLKLSFVCCVSCCCVLVKCFIAIVHCQTFHVSAYFMLIRKTAGRISLVPSIYTRPVMFCITSVNLKSYVLIGWYPCLLQFFLLLMQWRGTFKVNINWYRRYQQKEEKINKSRKRESHH